ncbi:nuclear pore complex protein Nup155 isoform X2 [Dermacentor albipictus]|uniref:nuclear pore complex protein Nup155 isoform X2 n=1 Tax=Dermacentor albipictus TaxID=60249 RepID=UPI0038FC6F0D
MAPLLSSPPAAEAAAVAQALESTVKLVEHALQSDSSYPLLVDQFAAYGPLPSCSGLQDLDYPADPYCVAAPAPGASSLLRRVPLPAELVEQAAHAQMQCRLGLFPEIGRAWLAVDSDLFVWRYETGDDLAYFDGLSEAILAVGLVHPQPGVFQRQIHSLLCLATCTEIVILGATLQGKELLLLPEPVFTLSADGAPATCVVGSASGRIFLGGRDGCLYEIVYSAGSSWFGSRCRKVNHSSSTLAYLLPAFLSLPFGEEDPIVQVVVDDGRKALYTRSERGTLQLFDLGVRGDQASRVISLQLHQLVQMASRVAPTVDTDNFRVLVHIQVIPPAESPQAHLVVITQTGVRLYLTTISHGGPEARPSTLALLHVRLPPGFTSHAPPQRVRAVRTALCHRGTTVLVAAHSEDKDVFWTLAADAYPFQPCFMESSTFGPVDAGVCCLASAEAASREWASLGQLLQLVKHTAELLGLWKVLCDHQFRAVSAAFPPDLRDQLRNATLRELVLADRQLPAGLAAALVQTYLEDNAAAESVSNRLRSVCPSLYRIEDALFTRAHEKLLAARTERNAEERRRLLDEALTLCKQVGPQLPLGTACGLLTSCGHHAGVIDLSLSIAKQRDPQGLALHFYRQGERPEDERGRQAYGARIECYQAIRDMLSELRATSNGSSYETLLGLALRSDDETFHASLYDWLCESGQSARLLDVRSPFLEAYLQRRCDAADLLWKYHERVGNYGAAARILAKLADRPGADATLARRLEYLARAIVCVKSTHFQVTNAAHEGNFLHQLEEKLEVARLQAKVRDALLRRPDLPMATDLAARLDAELVDVTHLYGEYADPYDLAECKLAIVRSSGYDKPLLVESLWQSILEREFHENARPDQLSQRLESLAREYAPSEKFFPLALLVKFLELRGSQHGFEPGWILGPLLGAHVSISRLRDAYNDLYRGKDPAFAERSLHLLRAIARLIGLFLDGRHVEGVERRRLANRCLSDIPGYLIDLQSTAVGDEAVVSLIGTFKELQASLENNVAN